MFNANSSIYAVSKSQFIYVVHALMYNSLPFHVQASPVSLLSLDYSSKSTHIFMSQRNSLGYVRDSYLQEAEMEMNSFVMILLILVYTVDLSS